MKEQGYKADETIFYQDNISAMKLEKSGRASAGSKSRHIDICYFSVKDAVKQEGIDIEHCPTEFMWADFYTKPLQGSKFKEMRQKIMGHLPI